MIATLRLVGGGLLAGLIAGAGAGLGSRGVMYVIRLLNPTKNGETTHAGAVMGRFTVDGTLSLVLEGAFYGLLGGALYLLVRRWMPGQGWLKGLVFGSFLLLVAGPAVIDGDNYEYFRYVPPAVSVSLFALLYPLYGMAVAPLAEYLGRGATGPPGNKALAWSGYLALAGVAMAALLRDVMLLRQEFHIL